MEEKPAQLPVSPQEIQVQAPPLLDKLKIHKFKILAGILGVLVLAGAVFGAYKFSQRQVQPGSQPTPTPMVEATPTPQREYYIMEAAREGWKKLVNQSYNYSLELPSGWFINKSGPEIIITSYDSEKVINPGLPVSGGNLKIEIIPETNPEKLSIVEFWVDKFSISKENIVSTDKIDVSGNQAVRIISKDPWGLMDQHVLLEKDKNVIILNAWGASLGVHKDTFNLMLSTFKFLE
ncbi:MAG: hypothetical protein ACOZBZ_00760 [Patescibacteria group bacterium]